VKSSPIDLACLHAATSVGQYMRLRPQNAGRFFTPISHPLPLPTHLNLISWSVIVTKAVCQGDTALCQTEAASSIGHRSLPEGALDHRSYAFFARQGSNSIVQKGASTHYWQCWGVGRGAWGVVHVWWHSKAWPAISTACGRTSVFPGHPHETTDQLPGHLLMAEGAR
jgi:hypothetical protein